MINNLNGITILGLGPGDPNLLTREAWEILNSSNEIYFRTTEHPTLDGLPKNVEIKSFDDVYEKNEDFGKVYDIIVSTILELGNRPQGVVYAVPGHPFVAESTTLEIIRRAKEAGIPVRVIEGLSFIEPTLGLLKVDPLPHLTIVDALELMTLHHPTFPPNSPALIAQVHSKMIAAELKITLMAAYPDEHPAILVHGAGTDAAKIESIQLHEIDQSEDISLLTSLYLPPLGENTAFEEFQELIAHLRSPVGCPWDREQTHQTLRTNLLEESYEVLNALDADDPAAMQEEFGDLLLQIVLHAQIASEYGEFTMTDIINNVYTKLVNRHPHVFEDLELRDADAVIHNWERIKENERSQKGRESKSLLDGISLAMPALAVSDAYQRRAARMGFDWEDIEGVVDKIVEEVAELRAAKSASAKEEEYGDLIFALVNLARWLELDAESSLRKTNAKFLNRFSHIEKIAKQQDKNISDLTLEEMEGIWEEAKRL